MPAVQMDSGELAFYTAFGFLAVLGYIFLKSFGLKSLYAFLFCPLNGHQKQILAANSAYYQHLPEALKAKFEKRVGRFILSKQFIFRNNKEVTDKMKVLIGAVAVQITFGLQLYRLPRFRKILLNDGLYTSSITGKKHKGEVNPGFRLMILSWKHFLEGHNNPRDGVHLGLHEMAHALRFQNRISEPDRQFLSTRWLQMWRSLAEKEIKLMRTGKSHFLRSYAAVNLEEFFAVSVEVFFEQPHRFYREKRELYVCMVRLLRQDPRKYLPR